MRPVALAAALVVFASVTAQQGAPTTVRIVGRIVSVLHEGVPAAEVWATGADGAQLARTVADGDGYYQLARLPAVPLRVCARASGKVDGRISVVGAGAVRAATLMLEDGDPLQGTVVFADGSAAAGASVLVAAETWLASPFDWSAEMACDAKGAWSLPSAPLRSLRVRVFVPGHALGETIVPAGRGEAVRTKLAAGEAAARRVVVKGGPAGQTVRVVADLGNDQRRRENGMPRAAIEAVADDNGVATLWDLPMPFDVRVDAQGYRSMPVCVPCRPGAVREIEFTLSPLPADLVAPRTRISGQLVDEVGQPIAGARLVGRLDGVRGEPAITADGGAFELDVPVRAGVLCQVGLLAGDWCLGADKKVTLAGDGVRWLTISADPATPLRLAAQHAGALRGTLLGPNGTPFGAASVRLASPGFGTDVDTAANAAGVVDIAGLPPGRYRLMASQLDLVGIATVDIVAGGVAAMGPLEFPKVGELRGVATDGAGHPQASIVLAVIDAKEMQQRARMRGLALAQGIPQGVRLTDRNGNFRVPSLSEGEWAVASIGRSGAVIAHRGAAQPAAAVSAPVTVEAGKVARVDLAVPQ